MSTPQVNERTSSWVSATFRDRAGAAVAPLSVEYQIDCLTTGTVIVPRTAVTAGATVELAVTPAQNRIVSRAHSRERRRVTVIASYGVGDGVTAQYDYDVVDLSGVV